MANGHDGGVDGTMSRIFDAHYRALKLQPLSQLTLTAPLTQGSLFAAKTTPRPGSGCFRGGAFCLRQGAWRSWGMRVSSSWQVWVMLLGM